MWYPRGRCPPFFSPSFSGENGAVSCASSVYIWGGSLVPDDGNLNCTAMFVVHDFEWKQCTLNITNDTLLEMDKQSTCTVVCICLHLSTFFVPYIKNMVQS